MNSLANLFDLAIHTKCMLLTGGGCAKRIGKHWKELGRMEKNSAAISKSRETVPENVDPKALLMAK